jgi:putative hydrolase of the HAD superfamily
VNPGSARCYDSIRAVTFDAAGTLVFPYPSVGAVYREIALAHGCDLDAAQLDRAFRAAFLTVSKNPLVLDPEARERDFWKRVVLATIAPAGATPFADFDRFFADLFETFAHASRWQLFPDAIETLTALKAAGLRLGVLSNWDRRLHTVLEETGLRPYLDAVIISSEVGAEKPDPGIFRAAESALGAGPGECLHVGDSRHHDLAGARGAGWRVVLVRHGDAASGDGEVRHLTDVVGLIH